MTSKYIFDNYALIEIIEGNQNYEAYLDSEVIINNFIFSELCYVLFRDKYHNAKNYIDKYSKHIVSVKPEWIEEAMKFRLLWKDRNVSITDCVSFIMAKKLGIKFLTGDKEFKEVDGVEFVK